MKLSPKTKSALLDLAFGLIGVTLLIIMLMPQNKPSPYAITESIVMMIIAFIAIMSQATNVINDNMLQLPNVKYYEMSKACDVAALSSLYYVMPMSLIAAIGYAIISHYSENIREKIDQITDGVKGMEESGQLTVCALKSAMLILGVLVSIRF